MTLKHQDPITFLNRCGAIFDCNELEKAVLWYSDKPVLSVKRVSMYGKYPCVSIGKEKIHIHRLLMTYWTGRRLERHEYVHHRNENKLDARRENLQLIEEKIHQSMHNKGKTLSYSHRLKIANANRRRRGIKHKKSVQIALSEIAELHFERKWSINKIANHFNVDWSTIRSRLDEIESRHSV